MPDNSSRLLRHKHLLFLVTTSQISQYLTWLQKKNKHEDSISKIIIDTLEDNLEKQLFGLSVLLPV